MARALDRSSDVVSMARKRPRVWRGMSSRVASDTRQDSGHGSGAAVRAGCDPKTAWRDGAPCGRGCQRRVPSRRSADDVVRDVVAMRVTSTKFGLRRSSCCRGRPEGAGGIPRRYCPDLPESTGSAESTTERCRRCPYRLEDNSACSRRRAIRRNAQLEAVDERWLVEYRPSRGEWVGGLEQRRLQRYPPRPPRCGIRLLPAPPLFPNLTSTPPSTERTAHDRHQNQVYRWPQVL
jgi:hypothetical protein